MSSRIGEPPLFRHCPHWSIPGPESLTSKTSKTSWLFRLFSGVRMEVQTATVKVDRVGEVLLVPKSTCRVLHPLNLGVDRLTGSVRHPVPQISNDVLEAALQHSPHLDHGFQPAAHRPVVPPAKVLARRPFIDVFEHGHGRFLQGPGSCCLQSAVPE